MTDKEAKDKLILLRISYKIRIEEEDIEALDKGIEALENQTSVISELKKIKEEIRNKRIIDSDFDFDTAGWCINLIERNISKLKGENNAEKPEM